MSYDVAVIGGGIIGLATARTLLQRRPGLRLILVEKEARLATHQTGRNSGVIHSGIYYRPGSLKAKLCVEGGRRLIAFCDQHRVPYRRCGKVIVAVEPQELPRLAALEERGRANGVSGLARLGPEGLHRIEPHVRGLAALHLPDVAVTEFAAVAQALAEELTQLGGTIATGARVTALRRGRGAWRITTTQGRWEAARIVNCAGLHADRVARMAGDEAAVRLVPFRGEYYALAPARASLINGLVYPVPDQALPFLGIHFTKTLQGGVHVGPSAVLALKREGYTRAAVSLRDSLELLASPGVRRMAARYWRTGLHEMVRSVSRRAFLAAAKRLVPSLESADLLPSPAGVRAQAIGTDGSLLDDFVIHESLNALHVYNAPSPAATAALSIAEFIAERFEAAGQG